MTRALFVAAAAMLFAGSAHAQMGPPDFDANHDGKVTFDEFKAIAANRMMSRMDADHDGRVSKAEYGVMVSRMAMMGGDQVKARAEQRFTEDDVNKDGFLSKAEVEAGSKRRFDRADTNHDGWLSKDEILSMRQNRRGGPGG